MMLFLHILFSWFSSTRTFFLENCNHYFHRYIYPLSYYSILLYYLILYHIILSISMQSLSYSITHQLVSISSYILYSKTY
ncbi:hypothetical protein BDB01DRAFT_816634, partial [Pilobolus umbonatus]